ncbi:MAG TPA: ATP synthase F1 subunit gamma [Clostridiales bacterium]|nr:ATP synthase F1 subunit gamma [Clostridiales bacterium]
MSEMRDIRLRMKSIRDTRQITNAMRLISATKLRRARIQLNQAFPYFDRVRRTMAEILRYASRWESRYFSKPEHEMQEHLNRGIILITGDKGLAGAYHHNIIKLAEMLAENEPNHILYIVGHMGREHFIRQHYHVNEEFEYSMHNPTAYLARDMTDVIIRDFLNGKLDEVYIAYTYMVSSIRQEPRVLKLLPLEYTALKSELGLTGADATPGHDTFEYEPTPEKVLEKLVPKYVKGILYGVMVEAFTCEQSARMTSMKNATDNADTMLDKLRMNYNRTRQDSITRELTEITSGMEGLLGESGNLQ